MRNSKFLLGLVLIASLASSATQTSATVLFTDDFDSYASPSTVTAATTINGYKILSAQASGVADFTAIFGFDYSTVTIPVTIPPAPHSVGGTTKGLFLTANKDATGAAAAVNLYPVSQSFSNNFSFKFDLWANWTILATSTEHTLFGINHSGNVANRVGQTTSDGLFFAMNGDGGSSPTSTTLRDYSVFKGAGAAIPTLVTASASFGPTPPLGAQFDNTNSAFLTLFPATVPGSPAGSAGLTWLSGEVRQENNLITWLLNGAIIAQYSNTTVYTNGNILLGYNDAFASIGDANNFAIFDNIRVESIPAFQLLSPKLSGTNFSASLGTLSYQSYTLQGNTNITSTNWVNLTNFIGNGTTLQITVPVTNSNLQFFRASKP